MPIYEYQCKQCHHQFEVLQKISDPRLTDCPTCHQSSLEKLISAVGFQLKGSGWYETDFKNPVKPKSSESSQPKQAETEKQPAVKTEKVTSSSE